MELSIVVTLMGVVLSCSVGASSQVLFGVARLCLELPGNARSCQVLSGAVK